MRTSIQHIANHIVSVGNWKPDCCGKQDFDLPLISTSCRYYPPRQYNLRIGAAVRGWY